MHRTLLSGVETPTSATPEGPSPRSNRDPYRGVVFVLLVASLAGAAGALAGELTLANPLLLDAEITFGLATRDPCMRRFGPSCAGGIGEER